MFRLPWTTVKLLLDVFQANRERRDKHSWGTACPTGNN
jgi:hypothetical protein